MGSCKFNGWEIYDQICRIVDAIGIRESGERVSDAYIQDETLFIQLEGCYHLKAHNLDINYSYWWNCPVRYMFLTVKDLEKLKEVEQHD